MQPSQSDYVQPAKELLVLLNNIQVHCPACDSVVRRSQLRHHVSNDCLKKERFVELGFKKSEALSSDSIPAAAAAAAAASASALAASSSSSSLLSLPLCIVCRDLFSAPNQCDKCSVCFLRVHGSDPDYAQHPLVIKRQRPLSEIMDWRMEDLDAEFIQAKPNCRILTTSQATAFINAYKSKPMYEILAAYVGEREFPAFALRAVDADRFLQALRGNRYEDIGGWVHLVGPRVVDRWAMKIDIPPLNCYYLNFGNLVPPPQRADLIELWANVGTRYVPPY